MPRPAPATTELSAPFWEEADKGRFTVQNCENCNTRIFPPRVVCPSCWSRNLTWVDCSGEGVVYSASIVHRAPNEAFAEMVPYVVALVNLDDGPRMMTNIVGCDPDQVTIGMRVTVALASDGYPFPLFTPKEASNDERQ